MTSELKEKLGKAREAYLALSQPDKDEYLKRLTEKHGSEFVTGFMTFMENGDFAEMSSEEEMKTLFEKAKGEYLALSDEEKKAYMDTFTKEKGESAAQAFLNYIEKGDFAEVIENIAELEPGKVEEGGTTLEEGYERSLMDILEVEDEPEDGEFAEDYSPVKTLLDQYKEEYDNLPEAERDQLFIKAEKAQGQEFATALRSYLGEPKESSEQVNAVVQEIFDNTVKEFADAKNKGKYVVSLSKDFSESTSEALASYLSGEINDFSILKAALEVHYAMKNFAEGEETPAEEPKVDNSQKFQNNEYLDVLVEKYKNLDDEAKTAMEAKMRSSVGDDLTDYIISRSKGEDFAEDDIDTMSTDEKPTDEKPIDQTPPANEPAPSEDVDYESLSTDLFGKVYEVNPVEESKAKAKEVDIDPTLPEGLVTEGGTTLEENYDRELKEDFSECRWDSLAIMFN